MINLIKIKKSFGNHTVLEIDNLQLHAGVYWIKGVNGCGKTTLLKAVAGIIDFDGDIILDDRFSIKTDPTAYRRLVNFAEAEPVFPDFLSGSEMIQLFCDAKGGSPDQADKYVDDMKMSGYIDQPIGKYSSGMTKKLSVLLAFIGQPRLILLDEPLITLDTESLRIVNKWIRTKHLENNVSFFLSSHQIIDVNDQLGFREVLVANKTVQTVPC